MEPTDPTDYATDNCTIARTLAVVGEKWTFLILREVFRGVRRFDDIRSVTRIPRQVLADRLSGLVGQDILRREQYQEPGQRPRHEYRLTQKGFDLYPVLIAMLTWGDRHVAAPEGPALRATHRGCGADVRLHPRCDAGHDVPVLRDIVPRPGPGAHPGPGPAERPGGPAGAQTVAGSAGSRV